MNQGTTHHDDHHEPHGKHRAATPVDSSVPVDGRHREDTEAASSPSPARRRWFSRG